MFSELTDQPEMYKNHRKTHGFCIFCQTTHSGNNFHNVLCPCPFAASRGAILRPSWGLVGPSCGLLGPSWDAFVPSWSRLKPSWGILGQSRSILGPCWAFWGRLGPILGPFLGHFGVISGSSWGFRGRPGASGRAIATTTLPDCALWA